MIRTTSVVELSSSRCSNALIQSYRGLQSPTSRQPSDNSTSSIFRLPVELSHLPAIHVGSSSTCFRLFITSSVSLLCSIRQSSVATHPRSHAPSIYIYSGHSRWFHFFLRIGSLTLITGWLKLWGTVGFPIPQGDSSMCPSLVIQSTSHVQPSTFE